mmetsp:Transcript_67464/g.170179  ORF Transcript_67464/g.170179 Transcript_67464/m.170179 type:complete len:209 (+) Transcript_67464:747-1373(+)
MRRPLRAQWTSTIAAGVGIAAEASLASRSKRCWSTASPVATGQRPRVAQKRGGQRSSSRISRLPTSGSTASGARRAPQCNPSWVSDSVCSDGSGCRRTKWSPSCGRCTTTDPWLSPLRRLGPTTRRAFTIIVTRTPSSPTPSLQLGTAAPGTRPTRSQRRTQRRPPRAARCRCGVSAPLSREPWAGGAPRLAIGSSRTPGAAAGATMV